MTITDKRIIRRQYETEALSPFANFHPLLQRIYAARQVKSNQEIERSLTHLLPYHGLLGLSEAAQLLAEAVIHNKRILIVGDFDADGATSTAVAIRALTSMGAKQVDFLVPNRFSFGYGLTPELIATIKQPPDVIVTVDNGIANHAGVVAAKQLGITVVITDHHLAAATLPEADAIVNPNQPQDQFASKHLAGVGVIFYVMLALRGELIKCYWFEKTSLPIPNLSRLLDIVALGTVADLAALDWNNRIMVQQGLNRIRAGQCVPGIIALLELAKRDFRRTVAADLGFAVGARLNAAGRLDDMTLGIECLLTDDPIKARELARLLDQLNHARRNIEQDMQSQALETLNQIHLQQNTEMPIGLCLFDKSWHQGVIGILASRMKDKFHRPVIIFAQGSNNELKGSARSIADLHIRDVLALIDIQYPGLIIKFGGHAMAAGLTIYQHRFSEFAEIFNAIVKNQMTPAQLEHSLYSDGVLDIQDFNLDIANLLREGGPWGQAFPEPLFDDEFIVLEQRLLKDKHLKLRLAKQDTKQDKILEAMAFFVNTDLWPNHRCRLIHAAYRLDINEYKGQSNLQLIIEHLVPV
jgi:single-stranded-DNA-specific exonuclease